MIHKTLDIVIYSYAILWSIALIIFILYKQNKWINNLFNNLNFKYQSKFNKQGLIEKNLKTLNKIPSKPGEKEYYIKGTKVCGKNFREANLKYQEILKLKITYEEIKI